MKKSSQLYTKIGKYIHITPVINLKMYYFAYYCLLSIFVFHKVSVDGIHPHTNLQNNLNLKHKEMLMPCICGFMKN